MKKLIPILAVVAILASACQIGGGGAPTPISNLPTALPTNTPPSFNEQSEVVVGQPGEERISSADGMPIIYIPEGTFRMGGIDDDAKLTEKPAHAVQLKGFWIDKFEVTNGMYKLCVKAGTCEPPQRSNSEGRKSYYNNDEFNDYPVVYVTWLQAANYCKWAGRRLPYEAEWERAARGDDTRTYPWGDEKPDSSRGNFNYFTGDTTRVGNFAAGASPFGVLDMAGNVTEWVKDFYDPEYYKKGATVNPTGPASRSEIFKYVVRGGNFQDVFSDVRVSYRTGVVGSDPDADPINELDKYLGEFSPKIGFRCAQD